MPGLLLTVLSMMLQVCFCLRQTLLRNLKLSFLQGLFPSTLVVLK